MKKVTWRHREWVRLLNLTGYVQKLCCGRMRLKYSQGLIKDGATIAGADENGVFDALGLPYPQPPQREVFENKPAWMPK